MKCISLILFYMLSLSVSFGQSRWSKPEVDPITIQKKFIDWLNYNEESISLSKDFIPLNSFSEIIEKKDFLELLTTGKFIPIKMFSSDNKTCYKLYDITITTDTSVSATISQIAFEELAHLKMEGTLFPKFEFKDIDGNLISNNSFKDKYVVIKCWYIHCASCIKEFSEVNDLVKNTPNSHEILFLSLAEDTPEQLKTFLKNKPLLYKVVPNMKHYMNETLQLNSFPTHFIINKQGIIVKVVSDVKSLREALLEK